jgi:hypothetical protein
MLDREGVHRIDREGVHRILAAVNLPLVPNSEPDPWGDPLPSPEDRLLADLEGWQSIHRTGEVQRRRPADREELARGIIAAGKRFNAGIDKYIRRYGARYLLRYRIRIDPPPISQGRPGLDSLRQALDDSPGLNRLIGFKQQASLSNFENAVGVLHDIFTRHFGIDRRYTVRRDDPEVNVRIEGPFILFAEATLNEMGLAYSRRSIADALVKVSR